MRATAHLLLVHALLPAQLGPFQADDAPTPDWCLRASRSTKLRTDAPGTTVLYSARYLEAYLRMMIGEILAHLRHVMPLAF